MPGKILRLEELLSPAVADLSREKTAFFIPISPIEGHGPHLPLGVDYFNAIHFAETTARVTLERRPDFDAVICPAVPVGTQVYRLPGSLRSDSHTVYKVALTLGESLALWGFRYIFLLSGHGSPKNIVALESAALKVSRKYHIQMHSLSGALAVRFLKGDFVDRISAQMPEPLTDEQKKLLKSDIHGGWWETSMMLLLRPELVSPVYKNLASVARTDKERRRNSGYIGSPALADTAFAEASLKVLTEEGAAIVGRILDSQNQRSGTVSPLYNIIIWRPNFYRFLWGGLLLMLILILLAIIIF